MTITLDDRRPLCMIDTVAPTLTWAWITRTVDAEKVVVALAEVGLRPDEVWTHPIRTPDAESWAQFIYHRALTDAEHDLVEKAVRLARVPMAYGGSGNVTEAEP